MIAADIPRERAEIVHVSDEVAANNPGATLYPRLMAEAGIATGDPIPIQHESFDMSAQVAGIMEENPDLAAPAALPESASNAIKELRRQGFEGRVIGSRIFADPCAAELFGPGGDGTLVVAGLWRGRTEQSAAFDEKFLARLEAAGIRKLGAGHTDAQAYDGVCLLKQLMERTGVTGDPAKLDEERAKPAAAMEGVRFSGVVGDGIRFQGHDAGLPGRVIEIKDGAWTKFAEAPADQCG